MYWCKWTLKNPQPDGPVGGVGGSGILREICAANGGVAKLLEEVLVVLTPTVPAHRALGYAASICVVIDACVSNRASLDLQDVRDRATVRVVLPANVSKWQNVLMNRYTHTPREQSLRTCASADASDLAPRGRGRARGTPSESRSPACAGQLLLSQRCDRGAARSLVVARAQHVLLALRIRASAWRGAGVTNVTAVACVRSLACPASRAFVRSLRA